MEYVSLGMGVWSICLWEWGMGMEYVSLGVGVWGMEYVSLGMGVWRIWVWSMCLCSGIGFGGGEEGDEC